MTLRSLTQDHLDLFGLLVLDREEPDERAELVHIHVTRVAESLVDAVPEEDVPLAQRRSEELLRYEVGFPPASITASAVSMIC